jgi:hypothetical protein
MNNDILILHQAILDLENATVALTVVHAVAVNSFVM